MIYVAAAIYSALAYGRRVRDREALFFGLLTLSLAVQNVGLAAHTNSMALPLGPDTLFLRVRGQ